MRVSYVTRRFDLVVCNRGPPILSSTAIWSSIPNETEIGHEEAFFRRTDYWLPA